MYLPGVRTCTLQNNKQTHECQGPHARATNLTATSTQSITTHFRTNYDSGGPRLIRVDPVDQAKPSASVSWTAVWPQLHLGSNAFARLLPYVNSVRPVQLSGERNSGPARQAFGDEERRTKEKGPKAYMANTPSTACPKRILNAERCLVSSALWFDDERCLGPSVYGSVLHKPKSSQPTSRMPKQLLLCDFVVPSHEFLEWNGLLPDRLENRSESNAQFSVTEQNGGLIT
jgi:hypothetical protein